jgi:broad specificity phosphatase PhoE
LLTDTNITTLDFLRHGATTGGSYYRGSTDDPLSKLGWQQMSTAVANRNWDLIISSPLLRCLDFAQHLNRHANTPFCIEPTWQEIHFGDREGKTADQIDPAELQRFYQDPLQHTPKHGLRFCLPSHQNESLVRPVLCKKGCWRGGSGGAQSQDSAVAVN